jgi:hypothetical protein
MGYSKKRDLYGQFSSLGSFIEFVLQINIIYSMKFERSLRDNVNVATK